MRSLLLLACLAAPIVARHSLNYGPASDAALVQVDHASSVSAYSGPTGDVRQYARNVAETFIGGLLDSQAYRFISGALNQGNGIYSAHFVQRYNGRDVVTGTLNVNVDVASGKVISYSNAFHDQAVSCGADRVASGQGAQVVLGASGNKAACVNVEEAPVDPRVALVSFLLPVRSANGIFAVAPDSHLDDLVDNMSIEHPLTSTGSSAENRVLIHNAPSAEKPVEAKLAYIATHDGKLKLVWEFVFHSNDNSYNSFVAANKADGLETLAITDWVRDFAPLDDIPEWPAPVPPKHRKPLPPKERKPKAPAPPPADPAKAEYKVFGWGCNDPTECDRKVLVNPADSVASPHGWHHIPAVDGKSRTRDADWAEQAGWSYKLGGGLNSTDTRSNNVFAQDNPSGGTAFELNHRPVHANLSFHDKLHWGLKNWTDHAVDPASYIDVSVTELFYTINELHDLLYHYGFDEESGNFQQVNDKTGRGLGGDPVIAMAQDGSGTNNANFMTPPDAGRMRMYVWTTSDQLFYRDGDLEAGIVTHEYTHGVSTRLTGPPSNPSCLGWGEAGGMGEGWGDYLATVIRMRSASVKDWPMGNWAFGNRVGIRHYRYSLNFSINPSTYTFLNKPGYWGVHAIGEVWAEMLFEVTEALIAKHGFSSTLFPPHSSKGDSSDAAFYNTSSVTGKQYPAHGNTLSVQLVLDGMKLQPCRPRFIDARDAILQADKILTGGDNFCDIWKAFSRRGLGPKAKVEGSTPWGGGRHDEDFSLPAACKSKKH